MKTVTRYALVLFLSCIPLFISCDNEPLTGEFTSTPDGTDGADMSNSEACLTALGVIDDAEFAFGMSNVTNYSNDCTALAQSIDTAITLCGDADGDLAAQLALLGDCTTYDACLVAEIATNQAEAMFEDSLPDDELENCQNYTAVLLNQIAICGDVDGGLQELIDTLDCVDPCPEAEANTATALEAFMMADLGDLEAYVAACAAYSFALQEQISACGDDGTLLALVQELGDCTPPEGPGPVQMDIDEEYTNFNTAMVTISGTTLSILATDIDEDDTFAFDVVAFQTGTNIIQNPTLTINDVVYTAIVVGDEAFTSNTTQNEDGILVGTFEGPFVNSDGTVLIITNGEFDIEY